MIGLFAGRGDVIVSMAISVVFGLLIGWWLRGIFMRIKAKFNNTQATR